MRLGRAGMVIWRLSGQANSILGWAVTHTIEDMCRNSENFAKKNAETVEE